MSSVLEIEQAIEKLSSEERQKLREWLEEMDSTASASRSVFAAYEDEEKGAQQWQD